MPTYILPLLKVSPVPVLWMVSSMAVGGRLDMLKQISELRSLTNGFRYVMPFEVSLTCIKCVDAPDDDFDTGCDCRLQRPMHYTGGDMDEFAVMIGGSQMQQEIRNFNGSTSPAFRAADIPRMREELGISFTVPIFMTSLDPGEKSDAAFLTAIYYPRKSGGTLYDRFIVSITHRPSIRRNSPMYSYACLCVSMYPV